MCVNKFTKCTCTSAVPITPTMYMLCMYTYTYILVCCDVLMRCPLVPQINRFRIYLASLSSDAVIDFNAPLSSGLIPSLSVNTLHNPDQASGESDFLEEFHRHGHTSHIVVKPPVSREVDEFPELKRHSSVLSHKPHFK